MLTITSLFVPTSPFSHNLDTTCTPHPLWLSCQNMYTLATYVHIWRIQNGLVYTYVRTTYVLTSCLLVRMYYVLLLCTCMYIICGLALNPVLTEIRSFRCCRLRPSGPPADPAGKDWIDVIYILCNSYMFAW